MSTKDIIRAVRSQDEVLPFEYLIDSGLLWFINDRAFHLMGRKLEIHTDPATGQALGFRLVGDGKQPITHDPETNKQRYPAATAVLLLNDDKPPVDWYRQGLD